MRRFLLACLLALPLAAASQQEAKAWCKFGMSLGFNMNYASGGHRFACETQYSDDCGGGSCGFGQGFGMGSGFGGMGFAQSPAMTPAPAVEYAAPAPKAAVTPAVWYSEPTYPAAGYAYPAPSYGYYPTYDAYGYYGW